MVFRFGVRCEVPISPTVDQGAGDQVTVFKVLSLLETFREVLENAEAFALTSPLMVRFIILVETASALN